MGAPPWLGQADVLAGAKGAPAGEPPTAAGGPAWMAQADQLASGKLKNIPTAAQQATALWARTSAIGKPLIFVSQGLNDVGTGIDHLLGISTTGPIPKANYGRYAAPAPQPVAPSVNSALDAQHPLYNYLVKWPTEFAASTPLGEAAGAGVGALMGRLGAVAPEGANILTRALYALPRSAAMGAAYGVQQPTGKPLVNAGVGAVTAPLFGAGADLGGKALNVMGQGVRGIARKIIGRELKQPEIDSILAARFAKQGLPTSVAPRTTAPGVELTTAVHSGNPRLMALQAAERIGGTGTPFYDLAGANNQAIVNGLQKNLAPQADNSAVSTAAHDLLAAAQKRGKATVTAAYKPFDEIKGGVFLDREPIENALREAYNGLLPTHREIVPSKVRDIIGRELPVERQIVNPHPQALLDAARPLHLTNDIEDLGARLTDAIGAAKPGTPAAHALMTMRDALNKGVEASRPVVGSGGDPVEDATQMWANAKAANTAFRERFPQGTARDTEARQWLSERLSGKKDPTKLLTKALDSPARAKAVLNAFNDTPTEREQMRGLLRNGYVNQLLSETRAGIPGMRTLNADALTRARANNSALERALLTPQERNTLDRYVEAAHDNTKILQRLHTGSSETAALRNYGKENDTSVTEELLKHGASAMHPAVGFLARILPALAKPADNEGAINRTLLSALLTPDVYNRVAGTKAVPPGALAQLLSRLSPPARTALARGEMFVVPRMLNGR